MFAEESSPQTVSHRISRRRKSASGEAMYRMRLPRMYVIIPILIGLGLATVIGALIYDEMKTSRLQAEWLSANAAWISFAMEPGENSDFRTPSWGPYNDRLGYSYLPFYIKALQADDYQVTSQMRGSPTYYDFLDSGFYAPYHPKTVTGLTLYDREGALLYGVSYPTRVFTHFYDIPKLLVDTLLYVENRELMRDGPVTRNPVIEWDRFFYALVGHIFHGVIPGTTAGGGSTLATQIEKFRFSPKGQTTGSLEKLRQIASASLRVYLDGQDTRAARERIVLDYLNSTPLSARSGFGEVNSIGDGLWAWFGINLNDAATALNLPEDSSADIHSKAHVYRAALGLILSQRRPSFYLSGNRDALEDLTNATLDRLAGVGIISPALRDEAKKSRFHFIAEIPQPPTPSFIEQKAVNSLRTHLMSMLGLKKFYELDRIDLSAHSTLDQTAQQKTADFLKKMNDEDFLQSIGLYGFRLLNPDNDPSKIKWSVVLYERTLDGNKVRIQADSLDAPFDMNEGMKLDLGSTAKLRTLVTYLEIINELHRRYAGLSAEDLRDMREDAPDALTQWATEWLMEYPEASLDEMLQAAMDRAYSANPGETFFTGGGVHMFKNFEHSEDYKTMDLHEAFQDSVNLVFVRVMRDIVNYTIGQGAVTKQELLNDPDQPARQEYLERFADQEGSSFLNRYIADYASLSPDEILDRLTERARHKSATSRTILFRSTRPEATFEEYAVYMKKQGFHEDISDAKLQKLFNDYPPNRFDLSDQAYVTGLNPMELWLAAYLQDHPHAKRRTLLEASRPARIESYGWLFRPSLKHAQDTRIRIMLEQDAFTKIQKRWARLGYPFARLTPSLATAIGSSADRPGALAELVGILMNDGKRMPTLRFESLEFAQDTPYQTLLVHDKNAGGEQVLDPEIAKIVRDVMTEVVEDGTARRVRDVYKDNEGNLLPIGGKTGTGDNHYDEYGPGGRVIDSRVVSRSGTFVFYIGDKFFGAITAHVAGEDAGDYTFTSALSAQMLKALAPIVNPLINGKSE
jgi:membrane peptidoglycan carboxypeptidase